EYRSTGTFHALVISGTHVAVLAAFFLFLLRLCFVPEPAALLLTVLAAWLYALITGWQAPCVRSAAGLTLFMIAGYFYREQRIMNLLAAIALGFLVFDPEQLFDASFQLTFLAVGFLGAFAVPLIQATSGPRARALADLADTGRDLHLPPAVAQFRLEMRLLAGTLARLTRIPDRAANLAITLPARLLFWIYDIVVTSAVVQMGLALPMVVYFHRVGFSGLSANAFVIPIMGLVVPLGFVAICTGWGWVAAAAGKLLALSRAIVAWHAALEPAWRIPAPPLWLAAAISAALIATALVRGRLRIAAAGAAGALLAILVWHPFPPQHHPGELELTDIDVGQGESLLVGLPDGKHMLVDGGGIPAFGQRSRTQLDIGEDVVAPYLWSRSIRTLDIIAISHIHDDHLGGIPALIDDFHPKELWTGATPDSPLWRQVCERAARNKTAIVRLQAGRHLQFGGAEIDVLAPPPAYVPADVPKNNDSLVFRIRYGRHAFLLTGDIERGMERAILPRMAAADVLKVAHHGSKTSSSNEFLDAVKPSFALISAGLDNIYGYPAAEILRRLQTRHAFVLRTDRDGLISISSDGRRLHVETDRWRAMEPKLLGLF
ncbi:MAG TPA: ComEC/Rec2 family competence protein, partial [Bryobacteraceae bacterium]|nr:ComEC/Rec2 family competence protein [Bryobacteraceae bacterium]